MTLSTGQRKSHTKNILPKDPAVKRYGDWYSTNRDFHVHFRRWLYEGGYEISTINIYSVAARAALGLIDKPYWTIDPQADLDRVRQHLTTRPLTPIVLRQYTNGLTKLEEYLCLRCQRTLPEPNVNWDYYLATLPVWLANSVRLYVQHRLRTRRPEDHHRATLEVLGPLTAFLRWVVDHTELKTLQDLTPEIWFEYAETRLAANIQPLTINTALSFLLTYVGFCQDAGQPICQRALMIRPLKENARIPKDVPVEQLRRLWESIAAGTEVTQVNQRRQALMDQAWFHLMLHCGLRSCEVRRLKLDDIDWENRRIRIEQSKGLKDRFVYLSEATIQALKAYLEVRPRGTTRTGSPANVMPHNLFIHQHQPLGRRYLGIRLNNYGKSCGIRITAHQLRHSFATLLLNAGAPILTVQNLLGHKYVDTTLGYARLYDGTVAADYYGAMVQVENRLKLAESETIAIPSHGELLAMVDSLRTGTLNERQIQTVHALRAGIMAQAEREAKGQLATNL
jgi:site-specific recombinase XerD